MACKLSSFLAELKRRKVYHVGAAYVLVGWGVSQGAEFLFGDVLGLHDAVWQVVIGLVVLGFPIALVLAWAYEVRPEERRQPEPGIPFQVDTHESDQRISIVVLPFDNMSPDPGDAYFCDGLTEEIITNLSHIRSLRVISRNSAMVLKGTQKDTRTIGQELAVQYVLEGSVRKAGSDLRITAQLIDATSDAHVWAQTYNGVLDDVFGMQETLSRSIVGALKLELSPPEDHDLSRRPIKSLRAYDLYLLGRHHWHRFTQVDTEKAIELYQQAIAVDPNFALAHGGLAAAYLTISGPGVPGLPARVGIPKVRASAEKALLLDPNTVFGGVSMGFVHAWYDLDWEKAGRLFSRIVGANPGSSEAHEAYAMYLSTRGMQDEAMQHMEVAIDLDPLWPIYSVNAAEILCMSRKFDESLEYCRRALELDPSFAWAHIQMAMARIQKGEYEQAIDQIEDRVDPRFPWAAQFLGYAYGKSGRNANALQVLGRLESLLEEGFASAANLALVHLGLGAENQALDHLEVALDEQPPGSTALAYLGVEPAWDPLRSHERFQQVLARIGMGPQEIN